MPECATAKRQKLEHLVDSSTEEFFLASKPIDKIEVYTLKKAVHDVVVLPEKDDDEQAAKECGPCDMVHDLEVDTDRNLKDAESMRSPVTIDQLQQSLVVEQKKPTEECDPYHIGSLAELKLVGSGFSTVPSTSELQASLPEITCSRYITKIRGGYTSATRCKEFCDEEDKTSSTAGIVYLVKLDAGNDIGEAILILWRTVDPRKFVVEQMSQEAYRKLMTQRYLFFIVIYSGSYLRTC